MDEDKKSEKKVPVNGEERVIPKDTKKAAKAPTMTAKTYCDVKGLSAGWQSRFEKYGRKTWEEWEKLYAKGKHGGKK